MASLNPPLLAIAFLSCFLLPCSSTSVEPSFVLGIVGPFTSVSQELLAGAIAFDIDFRKNFEPDLVTRFGPPLIAVPDLHPDLRIQTVIGTSNSDAEIGVKMALDWMLGTPPFPQVDGIVGGYHSSVTAPIASNGAVFRVPQVSWGATSPSLSDTVRYPYFSRVLPPDGAAMWRWIEHFDIKSVAFFYGEEPFGIGLYQATLEAADATGQSYRLNAISIPHMPDVATYNITQAQEALKAVRETGTRFICLGMGILEAQSTMYVMEMEGMLYGGAYQILGSEAVTYFDRDELSPSNGLPVGFQKFIPNTRGRLFPNFEEMWTKLTPEDIYGTAARDRYMLDHMAVQLESAERPMLTDASFASTDNWQAVVDSFITFIFDAGYAFVFAINALLNEGLTIRQAREQALLDKIRVVSFEGISGNVSFDAFGDRQTFFDLWNAQSDGASSLVRIGTYDSATGAVTLNSDPFWATDEQSPMPPAALLECPYSFERDTTTGVCTPCSPGVGCGYSADAGFPIGIFGPFTSFSQDHLAAAVLFDLDFRKNHDAAVRQRFGPPIIEIPNLHPELRIKTQLGTSDSVVSVGMETTLNWFLGLADSHKVAGIVGGYHSAIAGPVSSNAQVFEVPQVSWGATSPSLSDKTLYPWFVRTIPPDSLQGKAMWAWMKHFNIPSATYFYTAESYGAGLFQTTSDLAADAGQPGRITGVGIAVMNEAVYDLDAAIEACQKIILTGSKFVMMAFTDPSQATNAMYAMELQGMLYNGYQILGAESIGLIESARYVPTQGLPLGFQKFQPVTQGGLYSKFLEMWRSMTPEDVYGVEARSRYMIDHFLVLPENADRPMLTEASFSTAEPHFLSPFVIDAAYTFVVAINNLLNAGIPGSEIAGTKLLQEVQNTSFTGVSGPVSYDQEGADRVGDFELFNLQDGGYGIVAIWSAGSELFTFQTANDAITWAGGVLGASAPDELIACAPGQRWDETAGFCIYCPSNWYSSGGVGDAAQCFACAAGEVGNAPFGASACIPCSNGTFRTISDDECIPCPAGMYGNSSGRSACMDCPLGEYSPVQGMAACEVCGANRSSRALFTTMKRLTINGETQYSYLLGATSEGNCGCDVGTRLDGNAECIGCGEGMICKGLNDVHIEAGYYAESPTSPGDLSIYKCFGDWKRCPGGLPGETCADGRHGITCSECLDGMTPQTGGACVDCGGSDQGPFWAVVLAGTAALIVIYHFIDTQNRATQSHALLLCAIAVGQLVAVTQQLGVVGGLAVDWEDPIKSFMKVLSLLTFNLEVLRINCVSSQGPVERFSMKVFVIFVTIALMLVIHAAFVIFRHKGAFRQQLHSLVAAVGSLFTVFYISVTSTVLEPLQCQKHPNSDWTIRSYQGIVCWDTDEHKTMLIIGSIAFFLVPVAYLAGVVLIVRQFPRRMKAGDAQFLKSFSFLFFRFRPAQNAFVLVQVLRSFFIALVLVIPDAVSQIFALEVIMLVAFSATIYFLPWRVMQANWLDCLFGGCTLLVVCMASLFVAEEEKDMGGIAWMAFGFILLIMTLVPVAILYGLYMKYFRVFKPFEFFLCHHKNGAGAYVRLLKMFLMESPKLRSKVFVDSDNLDNLDRLFDYVGNDTGTLAVICTAEVFTRPWCVGEMCTARLKKVKVVLVKLPSCELPDEEFLENLSQAICNIEVLTENGIAMNIVRDTMVWMREQPSIKVPGIVNSDLMNTLVQRLIGKDATDITMDNLIAAAAPFSPKATLAGSVGSRRTTMVYHHANMEAGATAYVLKKLLVPLLSHDTEKIPAMLESPQDPLNLNSATIVVVCTNGIFEDPEMMQVLLQIPSFTGALLPVLSEQVFRFPPKDHSNQIQKVMPSDLTVDDANTIALVVQALFKEIAIHFVAQHAGESNLHLAAGDVAKRLLTMKGMKGTASSYIKASLERTPTTSPKMNRKDPGASTSTVLTASLPDINSDLPFDWDLEM